MKNSNAIDGSIDYIESRLTSAFDIGELAQQSFFSKTHYQRLFRAVVGEPVMEYVKNRRLQLACRDVCAGSIGILDIALKYGYDSHEGFTRAFKAYFGVTPSEYRKYNIPNETEVIVMLSNEVLDRIGQNAEKTSAMLSNFIEEAEKLVARAKKAASSAGEKGTTTTILANELSSLAKRIEQFRNEKVRNLTAGATSSLKMFDKIFALIRCLDDGVFQMNLLRFFCGIETGRISPPKDQFEAIEADYARLCSQFVGCKEHMITLMNEAVEVVNEDIKQEAANCIKACIRVMDQAVEIGENTAASAHVAARSLGERGRAFSYIAKEVSASINILKNVTADFRNSQDLTTALSQLSGAVYSMNINGFNASVESARAGNPAECLEAADNMMKYAETLHAACQECEALCSEYERFMKLTKQNGGQYEHALAQKRIDDILFQSRILSSQFALESERINRQTIRALTQTVTAADTDLMRTRNIAEYREVIAGFLQELKKEVAVLEFGGSFDYFAKEYENFLKHI
ncbi:MAG: AraC family transcriptional regulator [Lachnospiraceae bacterium]|nr:AraC family transcriptional regulator [Lachnospiraceae bacterium]